MKVLVDVWYTPIRKEYEVEGYGEMSIDKQQEVIANLVAKEEDFVGRDNVTWVVAAAI